MKIVITLFHVIVLGIAILVIGIGAGYWGYGLMKSGSETIFQQSIQQQNQENEVSDIDNSATVNYSGTFQLSQSNEEVKFVKGDIEWNNPEEYPPFGLIIVSTPEQTVEYKKIGNIKKEGFFKGNNLILVRTDYGMDSEYYYVIPHEDKNYVISSRSSVPGYNNIDQKNTLTAPLITITELDFPEIIYGLKPRQTLKRYATWGGFWFDGKEKVFVFEHPDYGAVYENAGHGFSVQSPDGREVAYELVIDFVNARNVPQITWSDGTRNNDVYISTDIGGCGNTNVVSVMSSNDMDITRDLVIAGKNTQGDTMWALKNINHSLLKKIYDEQYFVVDYDGTGAKKISYDEFTQKHPVFFWKDSFGRMIKFQKQEFLPVAECAKPVIYLYPEHEQHVTVHLEPKGGFTYSEPRYTNGWNVNAFPDGRLVDSETGKEYPYLFWEGRGGYYEIPKKGFVVERGGVEQLLREKLAIIGLNDTEIRDFVEYWGPEMQKAPYYFVTFMGNQTMDTLAPLALNPKPDTVIRVLMDFVPLDQPIDVERLVLRTITRKGFTVVEWGGVRH